MLTFVFVFTAKKFKAINVFKTMEYNTVIKPKNKLFEVDFREIWQYRDLFSMFVKRDIITQYKQTILGPAWFFIQPIITTIMYMVIFGGIAKIPTDGLPPFLFYLAGITCWQYFADCLNKTSSTFTANQAIFGKVYFPRLIVPLSTVASGLVRMGIQFLLFIAVYVYYRDLPGKTEEEDKKAADDAMNSDSNINL